MAKRTTRVLRSSRPSFDISRLSTLYERTLSLRGLDEGIDFSYTIDPEVGSIIRSRDNASVDFPDPVLPTYHSLVLTQIYGVLQAYHTNLLSRIDREGDVLENRR